MKSIFIAGTDTDIGKTHVAVSLIKMFNEKGLKTFGLKPVASGCSLDRDGNLVNADALALQEASSIKRSYSIVNPFAFKEPIAPHLAAKNSGINLSVALVKQRILQSLQSEADINIIEGVGGWSVPLNNEQLCSDMVRCLDMPTILVVGMKLGCLNHAILTSQSIVQAKVPFIGWIANCLSQNMQVQNENIKSLSQWISSPCLGVMPFCSEQLDYKNNNINLEEILKAI